MIALSYKCTCNLKKQRKSFICQVYFRKNTIWSSVVCVKIHEEIVVCYNSRIINIISIPQHRKTEKNSQSLPLFFCLFVFNTSIEYGQNCERFTYDSDYTKLLTNWIYIVEKVPPLYKSGGLGVLRREGGIYVS